jgi:ERCC4-related helicase
MSTERPLGRGDQVRHARRGLGTVVVDGGDTVVVRFGGEIHECLREELEVLRTPLQTVRERKWHAPLRVIARMQAEAIQSANDSWGVFARGRVDLLPHQLWVCKRVNERWPTRWLVADDVGLGKTIEAGLILSPLLSRGTVRRLLILCPASLVGQWQRRLLGMFDIRVAQYVAEADTERAAFWDIHDQVVASLQTLRADRRARHERMLEAPGWDLLVVDEAHHLNSDEETGGTLAYRLVERLQEQGKVASMVFFTGTPHRGKEWGFWALLNLLRPDLFDPRKPTREQLPRLREAMIRNNKQNVTDMKGERLFQQPLVLSETYAYSPEEERFYETLTEFIATGKAYARRLGDETQGRAVMLVLIALQKLASSSVAAVARALRGRLERIEESRRDLGRMQARATRLGATRDPGAHLAAGYIEAERERDADRLSQLEEEIAEKAAELRLMENEEPRLRELVAAAEAVQDETKIRRVLEIIEERFQSRSVLFFTEYKATQSLLMSALLARHGDGCATFINGDERAEGVRDPRTGRETTISLRREEAAERFNRGDVRFLVSTEAGGEGIDLQRRCHTLVHVDLPWNPMRMHQRVGRVNRYGQQERVEVVSLRNPDTVEALVWEKLNTKINTINEALRQVMDEPEDLLQLVLGMTPPAVFRDVFAEAGSVSPERLDEWFDSRTAQFGDRSAIETVRDLVGNSARFNFGDVGADLPKSDLPALKPFFLAMLRRNGRRATDDPQKGLAFLTPEEWIDGGPGVRTSYDGLVFDRNVEGGEADRRIVGVGHQVFDRALRQAREDGEANAASLPSRMLDRPLVALRISDQVTGDERVVRSVVVGVEEDGGQPQLLRDWELLERLNGLLEDAPGRRLEPSDGVGDGSADRIASTVDRAREKVAACLGEMSLPFRRPSIEVLGVLWPSAA